MLAVALISALSCGKEDIEDLHVEDWITFVGTVSVDIEGETFDNETIKVSYTPSVDGLTASIDIYRIKFVPKMPVRVNVTIPGIHVLTTEPDITFEVDGINPLSLGGEFKKYHVTELVGSISGENISFSLNFGEYPTRYKGKLMS